MNKIIIHLQTQEAYNEEEISKLHEIFNALVETGGLLGMKNGSTNIHFDDKGVFQGINLNYWPWKRRKKFDKS